MFKKKLLSHIKLLLLISPSIYYTQFKPTYIIKVEFQEGINKIVVGAIPSKNKIGHSQLIGLNLVIRSHNSPIEFSPSINLSRDVFISKIDNYNSFRNAQTSICLNLLVGIIFKKIEVKSGFFTQSVIDYSLERRYNSNGNLYGSGIANIGGAGTQENLDPNKLQIGFIVSTSINLGKKEKWSVNFNLKQFVTSILNSDYILNQNIYQSGVEILKYNATPLIFTTGLAYKLK